MNGSVLRVSKELVKCLKYLPLTATTWTSSCSTLQRSDMEVLHVLQHTHFWRQFFQFDRSRWYQRWQACCRSGCMDIYPKSVNEWGWQDLAHICFVQRFCDRWISKRDEMNPWDSKKVINNDSEGLAAPSLLNNCSLTSHHIFCVELISRPTLVWHWDHRVKTKEICPSPCSWNRGSH